MLKPLILVLWIGGGDGSNHLHYCYYLYKKEFRMSMIKSNEFSVIKIICPLCGAVVDYPHILEYHSEYWASKGMYNSHFPETIDEFNKRFSILGIYIKEAYEVMSILTSEQIQQIKEEMSKGGKS